MTNTLGRRPRDRRRRPDYVWDYDLDEGRFRALLAGEIKIGRLDRDWAAVRVLEYAPYAEIIRLLGFVALERGWDRWREQIRSDSRRRGLDFVVWWLQTIRPDLLQA